MKRHVMIALTCVIAMTTYVHLSVRAQPPACADGRIAVRGGGCCFAGQRWNARRRACTGRPSCPTGMYRVGATCRGRTEGMLHVPATSVRMGFYAMGASHTTVVNVPSFYIDRTAVTVEAYAACVDARVCRAPARMSPYEPLMPSRCTWKRRRPGDQITCVDWFDAQAYCRFRGARLPTEFEWKLAAFGPNQTEFPWGDSQEILRAFLESTEPLEVAGDFPRGASMYGMLDVAEGLEWVFDSAGGYTIDPNGPDITADHGNAPRLVMGSSFVGNFRRPPASARMSQDPSFRLPINRFRCAVRDSELATPSGTTP